MNPLEDLRQTGPVEKMRAYLLAHPTGRRTTTIFVVYGLILGLVLSFTIDKAFSYPVYTTNAVRIQEAPNHPGTDRHYAANHWNAHRHVFAKNLSAKSNRKLRRGYNRAVDAYVAQHTALAMEGTVAAVVPGGPDLALQASAMPRFATWAQFKAESTCAMGLWGSAMHFLCNFSQEEDKAISSVTKPFVHETLNCTGMGLSVSLGTKAGATLLATTVTPQAVAVAGLSTAIGCVTYDLFRVINPF